jgi:hypothetical protein
MEQSKANRAIEILSTRLNESTSPDHRSALLFAIGVVEGVFLLNCKEKLNQASADDEADEALQQIIEAHKNESEQAKLQKIA